MLQSQSKRKNVMNDITKAKELLTGDVRCAIVKGDKTFVSNERGIKPLLSFLDGGDDYFGGAAADKIVGKAAAFVYAKAGIAELYATVLSKAALPVLNEFGIKYSCDTYSDAIRNRAGDGICPMEQTVKDVFKPDEAIAALRQTVKRLSEKR